MPKRDDIRTILILGSGSIVIGQGCEFDYSGTQACKALREEGYQVVLVNSNPATIMTDPEFSDRTYIEPITPDAVRRVIEKEHGGDFQIDVLLPTLGGQTALNCACALYDNGTLGQYNIEMIGATREVIYHAEDRREFKQIVESIDLKCPESGIATGTYYKSDDKWVLDIGEAWTVFEQVGLPAIIRPAFTLGGTGGGIAYNREEFEDLVRRGMDASMTNQILIDQSLIGWKEYELEVMRDRDDNVVIICSIENVDAMGVHTGDSITVAPAQTLTDKEYQRMRDAAQAIIRAIGVETGGSNIQFAIDPANGDMVVVEMNPRVSRSSALASKATGFPIAKIAAKLAVGYTLWELPNDITGKTVACFEPTIDYVVTKIPRWTFEKFPEADETLTTQMKSVGEAMSIGRTFKESLQKGIRSMEVKRFGLGLDANDKWLEWKRDQGAKGPRGQVKETEAACAQHSAPGPLGPSAPSVEWPIEESKLRRKLTVPSQGRIYYIRYALKMGWSIEKIHEHTHIDPWFLDQIAQLVTFEDELCQYAKLEDVPRAVLFRAKQLGYSDAQLANLYLGRINSENILAVRAHRKSLGIKPVYKLVDTCAAEFEATTPYYYSTYESPYVRIGAEGPRGQGAKGDSVSDAAFEKTEVSSPVCYMDEPEDKHSAPRPLGPSAPVFDDEIRVSDKPKIVILGGGPNRIGQGIEFDYCCVQAAFAADELGYESVMINSNPETVSTDYDTSDMLFFEPLTLEDVLNVVERINGDADEGFRVSGVGYREEGNADKESRHPKPDTRNPHPLVRGMIVQFGGQTPLNLAHGLETARVPIIGTAVDSIDLCEDRRRFGDLIGSLGIEQPKHGIAYSIEEAVKVAETIGYPVLVRPSFVLGGRAMETVFDEAQLRHYMRIALGASDLEDQPILIDDFLADAIECDVDVVADYGERDLGTKGSRDQGKGDDTRSLICGVMEHIEEAGVHSGDSACAVPPHSLPPDVVERLKTDSRKLADALQVRGLMNVQWAIRKREGRHEIYILEVNPRASRTVPFVSKATGIPWARHAAKAMIGESLGALDVQETVPAHTSVKESVFPFAKFPGVDVILGPEMRSTGEVMGADPDFGIAFAKSQMAAGVSLPTDGNVFLSVRDGDKPGTVKIARDLIDLGFNVHTTGGTHDYLKEHGVETKRLMKISEGRPHAVDLIKNGELRLVINTPTRKGAGSDEGMLRATALRFGVPMITTVTGAAAAVQAMTALRAGQWQVRALQDYFPHLARPRLEPAAAHPTG